MRFCNLVASVCFTMVSVVTHASVTDMETATKDGAFFKITCVDGSTDNKTAEDIRNDNVCGGPAVSRKYQERFYKKFDFGGQCTSADLQWALERVKLEIKRTLADKCFGSGWSQYQISDEYHLPECVPLWGPSVSSTIYFNCSR